MQKYNLAAQVTVTAYTTIKAATLEDAIAASTTRPVELSGGPYSRADYWIIEEADGSPDDIEHDVDL